jgi:MFS family permease
VGELADRRGAPARALRRAALVAVSAAALLPFVRSPLAIGAVLLVQALGERAVVPLVDSVSLEWCARAGTSYTGLRLFGSLGFVMVAVLVGTTLAARGDRPGDVLVPTTIALCVAGTRSSRAPSRRRPRTRARAQAGATSRGSRATGACSTSSVPAPCTGRRARRTTSSSACSCAIAASRRT